MWIWISSFSLRESTVPAQIGSNDDVSSAPSFFDFLEGDDELVNKDRLDMAKEWETCGFFLVLLAADDDSVVVVRKAALTATELVALLTWNESMVNAAINGRNLARIVLYFPISWSTWEAGGSKQPSLWYETLWVCDKEERDGTR